MEDKTLNLLPLLEKIAAKNNYKNREIKVTPMSTGGANYTSLLYLANISGDGRNDLRLFAKTAAASEKMRGPREVDLYEIERFFYTNLRIAYKQLEGRHRILKKHRLRFPKFYGVNATYLREVLVLEDLACQGFLLHDRMKPVDWKYAAAAVTQLAKFHALSFAFAHESPKRFRKVLRRWEYLSFEETKDVKAFYDSSVKTSLEAVREEQKDLLKSFLDRYNMTEYNKFYETYRRGVLLHGDYRPSNMLHRPKKDGTVELIPVDYQTLQYGSPVMDLLYFIFTATDGSARAQFYDKLVAHYHSELGSALHRLGLQAEDVFPEDEFRVELKEKLPYGLLFSILMLPSLLASEEDAPKMDSNLTIARFAISNNGDLYNQRLNEVVEDYIAWGILT